MEFSIRRLIFRRALGRRRVGSIFTTHVRPMVLLLFYRPLVPLVALHLVFFVLIYNMLTKIQQNKFILPASSPGMTYLLQHYPSPESLYTFLEASLERVSQKKRC